MSGWERVVQDGTPTLRREGAEIVCCERARPVADAAEIVAATVPDGVVTLTEEELTTEEGELATLAVATLGPAPAWMIVGSILGDDFCARFAGGATSPEAARLVEAAVRDMVEHHRLGLGRDRRRRFRVRPPRGFAARHRDLTTIWTDGDSRIVVPPASPVAATSIEEAHGVVFAGLEGWEDAQLRAAGCAGPRGLGGVEWWGRHPGGGRHLAARVWSDEIYSYGLRVEAAGELEARRLAGAVAATATLFPRPRGAGDVNLWKEMFNE